MHSRKVAGLVILMAMLMACGEATGDPETAEGTPEPDAAEDEEGLSPLDFRLEFTVSGKMAPYYYAQELGLYEEQGLDLTIHPGQGSVQTAQDVASGGVDIGNMSCNVLMLQRGAGEPLVSVGLSSGKLSLTTFVPEDSDADTAYDLEGKTVIFTAESLEGPLLPALFEVGGVTSDEVTLQNVQAAAKVSAYAEGRGDAMITSMPLAMPVLDEARPSKALLWADTGLALPDFCLTTTEDKLVEKSDLIRAFLTATYEGFAAARENPEEAVEAVFEAEPAARSETGVQTFELWAEFYCSEAQAGHPIGWNAPEDWELGVSLLQEYADLSDDVEPEELYTNEFFENGEPVSTDQC